MNKVKRWRYYCDYCKKAGGNKAVIVKHEERCTNNPKRKCGMCTFLELDQKPISEMLNLLPEPEKYKVFYNEDKTAYEFHLLKEAMIEPLKKLRELTDNCPACILAALRQKKIHTDFAEGFDYKKEVQKIFKEHNSNQQGDLCY